MGEQYKKTCQISNQCSNVLIFVVNLSVVRGCKFYWLLQEEKSIVLSLAVLSQHVDYVPVASCNCCGCSL